jgi:hypothetical protein
MNSVIITESRFPAKGISDLVDRENPEIFSLDGYVSGLDLETSQIPDFDIWRVWSEAYYLARNWYLPKGKDSAKYEGISFGKIIEIDMWYFWRDILEKIELLERIISATSPEEIYLATLDNGTLEQIAVGIVGSRIKITKIPLPPVSWREVWKNTDFALTKLKKWEIDRLVRLFVLAVWKFNNQIKELPWSVNRQTRTCQDIEVLALLEQPGGYLADSILPVLSFFTQSAVLLMDHRHQNKLSESSQKVLYFSDYFFRHLVKVLRYRRIFKKRWNNIQDALSPSLHYHDLDLWPIAQRKFHRVFQRKFPVVGVEIESARELLLKHRVKSLLLNSDVHHGGRLLTMVANQLSIPSLVIQHGATLGEWGYVPLYATCFAAWGNSSRQWLIERGVSHEQIIVTGQPRLDQTDSWNLGKSREEICKRLGFPLTGYLLLWAMDPIPKTENKEIFENLIEATAELPWLNLVIRPHPGIQQLTWIENMVREQENVVISPVQESLNAVLSAVDGVITQGSTVGIEAMRFDKQVVVFQPSKAIIAVDNVFASAAAITVRTVDELRRVLEEFYQIKIGDGGDPYAQARHDFVKQYFYAVDGKSGQRVAQALSKLIAEFAAPDSRNRN